MDHTELGPMTLKRNHQSYTFMPLTVETASPRYPEWFLDPDVTIYSNHGLFPVSFADLKVHLSGEDSNSRIVWGIFHDVDGHIGNVTLQRINLFARNAELAILIGEKSHWKRGVGGVACRLAVDHGFTSLALERIYLGTASANIAMRRLAISLGFTQEGISRKHLFTDGKLSDVAHFGLLRDEFLAAE